MNVLGTTKTRLATLTIAAVAMSATLTVSSSFSEGTKELCEGFLPANNMSIPVGFKSTAVGAAGLTEAQFNGVLDRITRLYSPVISQRGGNMKINRLWTDTTVNASAEQKGSMWILNMYGGLARHQATTEEGFALVVCHELGHHLGGAPKIAGWFGSGGWATNEGGADYYANLKCLRNYFAEDDNQALVDAAKADGRLSAFAANLCDQEFAKDTDRLLCKRATLGGISVANLFHDLSGNAKTPDFSTPDTSVVKKMDDAHPATQCRLDTYLAGSICNVDATVANSETDYRQGSCVQGVAKVGYRPTCWFKP